MIDFNRRYMLGMIKDGNPPYAEYSEQKECFIEDKGQIIKVTAADKGYQNKWFYHAYFEYLMKTGYIKAL